MKQNTEIGEEEIKTVEDVMIRLFGLSDNIEELSIGDRIAMLLIFPRMALAMPEEKKQPYDIELEILDLAIPKIAGEMEKAMPILLSLVTYKAFEKGIIMLCEHDIIPDVREAFILHSFVSEELRIKDLSSASFALIAWMKEKMEMTSRMDFDKKEIGKRVALVAKVSNVKIAENYLAEIDTDTLDEEIDLEDLKVIGECCEEEYLTFLLLCDLNDKSKQFIEISSDRIFFDESSSELIKEQIIAREISCLIHKLEIDLWDHISDRLNLEKSSSIGFAIIGMKIVEVPMISNSMGINLRIENPDFFE